MENFEFYSPTKVYFGKDEINKLKEVIEKLGKNVLLTYGGGSIKRNGIYDKVLELLNGYNIIELAGIEPNPRIGTVRDGVKLCRENNIDVILAVGGGSTIDCSKVIAAGAKYNGDAWELVTDSSKIVDALPLVTIPTMAATGSEMNGSAVITNPETNEKLGTTASALKPVASLIDPQYTYTLPAIQTAAGIVDIMSHTFEHYFNNTVEAGVQAAMCEGVLRTCIRYGEKALKEPTNYEARSNLMWASELALNGVCGSGKSGGWTCHPIEHELSAFYDITHGVGLAIVTPRWMRYVLSDKTVDKFVDYAMNVWNMPYEEDKFALANKAIDFTESLFASYGIPMNLGKLGIDDMLLEKMSHAVINHSNLSNAYVPLNESDVLEILKMCL